MSPVVHPSRSPRCPLVSVMMPCYNSASTLPWALGSLLAQTYENWECVLVDDGSTDRPCEVVQQADDPRIRYIRLEENRGRAITRQVALDHAAGELLCMLDADDWLYPDRIAWQVEVMSCEPRLAVVSTGMAIVDPDNDIIGVRASGKRSSSESATIMGPFEILTQPPVAHAPSMIRMKIAKQTPYDPRFLLSEDADFLIRALMDHYYAILPVVAYVYTEHASVTKDKVLQSHRYSRQIYWKHRHRFPVTSRVNMGKAVVKGAIYRAGFALGQGDRLIRRRSQAPSAQDIREFEVARQAVAVTVDCIFPRVK